MSVKFSIEDVSCFARECNLAKVPADEWVVIHSYLIDEANGRASLSPPMLAMKWDLAEVIFTSLLEEGMKHTAMEYTDAYLVALENNDKMYRVGIFPEKRIDMLPLEVITIMLRSTLTDEMYYDMYVKDGFGDTTVSEVAIRENTPPPKQVH